MFLPFHHGKSPFNHQSLGIRFLDFFQAPNSRKSRISRKQPGFHGLQFLGSLVFGKIPLKKNHYHPARKKQKQPSLINSCDSTTHTPTPKKTVFLLKKLTVKIHHLNSFLECLKFLPEVLLEIPSLPWWVVVHQSEKHPKHQRRSTCDPERDTGFVGKRRNLCFFNGKECPSLKLSNSLPLKVDGWETTFLLGCPIFRGYVRFRECNTPSH